MIDRNVDKNEAKESKIKQEKKSKKTYHRLKKMKINLTAIENFIFTQTYLPRLTLE